MEEEMGVVECGSPTLSGTRGNHFLRRSYYYLNSPTLSCMCKGIRK